MNGIKLGTYSVSDTFLILITEYQKSRFKEKEELAVVIQSQEEEILLTFSHGLAHLL